RRPLPPPAPAPLPPRRSSELEDERSRPAEMQSGGDFPRFAFAAGTDEAKRPCPRQGVIPLPDRAVGHSDDVRDPESREQPDDLRSEEHSSELQSRENLVCRLL